MRKNILRMMSALLTLTLALTLVQGIAPAAEAAGGAGAAQHWFYNQLTDQGRRIYDAMEQMYTSGDMAKGTASYDLTPVVGQPAVLRYVNGERELVNDFTAAKDAFDLEHPEAWYMDSSYFSFRTVQQTDGYHALIGPGRAKSIHLNGENIDSAELEKMDKALQAVVNDIVAGARQYQDQGEVAVLGYVHDQITRRISYRYETDCTPGTGNWKYIRTVYALVTHEGVCESYARSLQLILGQLGIPCVPVHGMQTSGGAAEPHMWNAVQIGGEWYIVDATWDDPVRVDADGEIIRSETPGEDGSEHRNYFLVGLDKTTDWVPSGQVSTGAMIFTYPSIAARSYLGDEAFRHESGLVVLYDPDSEMESSKAGKFTISFQGKGVNAAAKDGRYFLVKMYDYNPDGSLKDYFGNWYYLIAANALYADNQFLVDSPKDFTMITNHCKYVEFAITSRPPKGYDPESQNAFEEYKAYYSKDTTVGYYKGDGSDILVTSGLLYNPSSDYKAPPYVKSVYPTMTSQLDSTIPYRANVEFDDVLYRPTQADLNDFLGKPQTDLTYRAEVEKDMMEAIAHGAPSIKMTTTALDIKGKETKHELRGEVVFGNFNWHWACGQEEGLFHRHSFETCGVTGVDFDFKASSQWWDDCVCYNFQVEGLVGRSSGRKANDWEWVLTNPCCPKAYRSQGIDWNLWGQPNMLDELDMSKVITDKGTLGALDSQMNRDGYNGKLALTVEDISQSRLRRSEVTGALDSHLEEERENAEAVLQGSLVSLFEIGFTRLCRMTVLEPGQSVRLSVGFPAGVDYNHLENYVFKAYHFTRCEKGACEEVHRHSGEYTGEIIGVQELQISVTPYGLVIVCDSFSPFEIVAYDAAALERAGSDMVQEGGSTLVVGTDGNGSVTYQQGSKTITAAGADGMVSFEDAAVRTFTIVPKEGYVVDEVTFDGKVLPVSADNTVTIRASEVTAGSLLEAEFVPKEVREADQTAGRTAVQPNHTPQPNDPGWQAERSGMQPVPGDQNLTDPGRSGTQPQFPSQVPTWPWQQQTWPWQQQQQTTWPWQQQAQQTQPGYQAVTLPFSDVDSTDWFYSSVQYMYDHNLMAGTSDTTFSPARLTNRAQLVTILWRMTGSPIVDGTESFDDVDSTDYFAQAVVWATESGLVKGYSDTTFGPGDLATKEQLLTILYRYAQAQGYQVRSSGGLDVYGDAGDVSPYAILPMGWAVSSGIIDPGDGSRLTPQGHVTRALMAVMLHRFCENTGA